MNVSCVRTTFIIVALLCLGANQLWLSSLIQGIAPIPLSHNVKSKVTLLLMVTTHTADTLRRNIMRETYLSFPDRYLRLLMHLYIL
jgi:hypothetical protein